MPIKGLKQKHKKEKHLEMKNSKKKNTKTLLAYKRTKPLTGSSTLAHTLSWQTSHTSFKPVLITKWKLAPQETRAGTRLRECAG